jgi:enoyl-CoA hydratase
MPNVRIDVDAPVVVVTIDRPERRNAVDPATARELADAFREFEADGARRVAILTGAGGHFCAGFDLTALAEGDAPSFSPDGDGPMGPTRLRLTKPVIAAVEGYAVAGGLELALWCDLRVAGDGASFGVFSRRFGVPFVDGGTVRLPRIVGHGRAMDMLLTGRRVDAAEALAIGLVTRVVAAGSALDEALTLARSVASAPQAAMRGDRLSALEQWGLPETEAIANELRHGMDAIATGETGQGAGRFAEGEGRHGAAVDRDAKAGRAAGADG